MLKSARFRLLLLAVLVAGVVAVFWSLVSRQGESGSRAAVDLLDVDVVRRTTQFEYLQRKRGKVVFKVQASTSTLARSGVNRLQEVSLIRSGEDGVPTDVILGGEASYDIPNRRIEFFRDVEIRLSDGTRVYSGRVQADLESERVWIQEQFRFAKGEVAGEGGGLNYLIPQKRIEVDNQIRLSFPSGNSTARVRADRALYRLEEGRVELAGKVSVEDPGGRLAGEAMTFTLTPDRSLEKVFAQGEARLQLGEDRTFSGDGIHIFFDAAARVRRFEVVGSPAGSRIPGRAAYEQQLPSGRLTLQARRIQGLPSREATTLPFLERLTAEEEVSFRSPPLEIEEARSELLSADFFPDGQGLQNVELKGRVTVLRRLVQEGMTVEERLHSDRLHLRLLPGQLLHRAEATGNVDVEMNSPDQYRHLFARESLLLEYAQGRLHKAVARSDCVVETAGEGERRVLRAPGIEAEYREGVLETVMARGGVDLEVQEPQRSQRARSQELRVEYREGVLERAVQSGDFHLWERGEGTVTDLAAERATFFPAASRLVVSGADEPASFRQSRLELSGGWSDNSETLASEFVLHREREKVEASGQVRTVRHHPEGAMVVTAGRMTADLKSGWAEYSDEPRIRQGANLIRGGWIRLDSRRNELQVRETVESLLVSPQGDRTRRYRITSGQLVYRQAEGKAVYRDRVTVASQDLEVQAPVVEVRLDGADLGKVSLIVATGGVQITEKGRKATGAQAVYDPEQSRVVVSGSFSPEPSARQ